MSITTAYNMGRFWWWAQNKAEEIRKTKETMITEVTRWWKSISFKSIQNLVMTKGLCVIWEISETKQMATILVTKIAISNKLRPSKRDHINDKVAVRDDILDVVIENQMITLVANLWLWRGKMITTKRSGTILEIWV